ncbi:MAG: DUF167 domain-containing protein [Leptolyngbyaceae bacterium]|nr:DUF167 domain-containing protein [Leptolyngbyaceae bacterium]
MQGCDTGRSKMQVFTVRVKPNSRCQAIQTAEDGSLLVRLKSPPVDGKANAELIKLLSKEFGVPKSRITITAGVSSRLKRVELDDAS